MMSNYLHGALSKLKMEWGRLGIYTSEALQI